MKGDPPAGDRLDQLFDAAADLSPAEQRAFVDRECAGDPELLERLLRLLAADRAGDRFLARPVVRVQADDAEAPAPEPTRVGPYRLLERLGQGGMGTVFLAERDDDAFHRRVAVKLLRRGLGSPEHVQRFHLERQILARLEHPGIARLYDGGATPEGRPYLVLERVVGEPIDAWCDRRELGVEARLRLFLEVCAAVAFAHRNLVVHRDLKPSNILVTTDGAVKLLDFGIAKLIEEESPPGADVTRTGERPMTPWYATPEQIRGQPVTTATDVYTLGLLLHLLLSGQSPYRVPSELPHELERAIVEQEPTLPLAALLRLDAERAAAVAQTRGTSPRELRRRVRGDLDTIVAKALKKEPGRRYGSVRELADDVERHLAHLPVEAQPDRFGYRAAKFLSRHWLGATMGTTIALLVVGFSISTAVQAARISRERDVAEAERIKAQKVADFMSALFQQADPYRTQGASLTARQVVDQGRQRIAELGDQPAVQATLLRTLGQIYRDLGALDVARPLLEQAVALQEATAGVNPCDAALTLRHWSRFHVEAGDFDQAEAAAKRGLALARASQPPCLDQEAGMLAVLGIASHYQGRTAEGVATERQAVAAATRAFGSEHVQTASFKMNLGIFLVQQGAEAEAETLMAEAVETLRRLNGENDPFYVDGLRNLASVRARRGNVESALELSGLAIAAYRRVLGPDHAALGTALVNRAGYLMTVGRGEEALAHHREAIAILDRALGAGHPETANARASYSAALSQLGDPAAAVLEAERALAAMRAALGEDHAQTGVALETLGIALRLDGQREKALEVFAESRRLQSATRELGVRRVIRAAFPYGQLLCELGRCQEALVVHRDAIAAARAALPVADRDLARHVNGLAFAALETGDLGAAEAALREVLAALEAQQPPHPSSQEILGIAQSLLGATLRRSDRETEGLRLVEAGLARLRSVPHPDPFELERAESRLAAKAPATPTPPPRS